MRYHVDGCRPEICQIFVFGSNLAGIHGAGAARAAHTYYGAEWGVGEGVTGTCYALPTKDKQILSLTLEEVFETVTIFIGHTVLYPNHDFFVTRIGCGLAGFTDEQIAPMFRGAPRNCTFAEQWQRWLGD